MSPQELLDHWDQGSLWPAASGLDVPTAYQRALQVRQLRTARGEQPRGYKVGFTNRNIWPRYRIYAPIWGTVWDTTTVFCEGEARTSLAGTCQPRLESEAVFGIAATPSAGASLDQLLDCLEWVAPGFELVQSHQPGWVFTAADTVADAGLHGRLLVGRRVPVAQVAPGAETFEERLARCRVTLWRGNEMVEEGAGPLHALQHLVRALRDCPGARASRRRRRHDRHLDRHLAGGAGPAMERAIRLATFHARSHLRLREKPCNTDSSARAI
jgi:2-keto-4-pentenoate hydratase